MALFDRQIEVRLNLPGLTFSAENLRIDFEVNKDLDPKTNSGKIQIYNMSENSRTQIQELDDTVTLSAGYRQDVGLKMIFTGELLRVTHEFQSPDIISLIEVGDGIKAVREQRSAISFQAGSSAGNVLGDLASKLGLPIKSLPNQSLGNYAQGFSHSGSIKDALNKLVKREDLEWSVQDGQLQILPRRQPLPGGEILIDKEQGMLNSPERLKDLGSNLIEQQKKPGYKVKTLLNPNIQAGSKVRLNAGPITGEFRVESLRHVGSNYTNDFFTEVEIYEL